MNIKLTKWVSNHLPKYGSQDLWDLASEILTELSERDSVQYRIRATDESLAKKLEQEGNTDG
tara:strand:- start:335 stop:520 length:186 start_codon:yes stop_codon:yes gene_type:complete